MGGIGAMESTKRIWVIVALVAVTFVSIVAVIITLANIA
jgi:hypothetical protein